jgi:hypothetical protein
MSSEFDIVKAISDNIFEGVVAIVSGAAGLAFKFAGDRYEEVKRKLDDHSTRITIIEAEYVTRKDVEEILFTLNSDLQQGFSRAHQRIDELFRNNQGKN